MIRKTDHWTLCIATRGRPGPLRRLLSDLARQSAQPNRLVIVDAEPESGEALAVLEDHQLCPRTRAIYIPSNHKNLPYQRYLGWRVAHGCDWLLYLDDDLRLPQTNAIERILEPLRDGPAFPRRRDGRHHRTPGRRGVPQGAFSGRGRLLRSRRWVAGACLRRLPRYTARRPDPGR